MTAVIRRTIGLLLISLVALMVEDRLAAAQDSPAAPRSIQAAGRAGIGSYQPGHWGIVSADVANPTADAVEVLATLAFEEDRNLQFGRQIWIPPGAKRSTWYPVRPPEIETVTETAGGGSLRTQALLFDASGSRPQPIAATDGRLHQEGLLSIQSAGPLTAVVADEDDEDVITAVTAMRLDRNLSKRVLVLEEDVQLPSVEALEALDQLVISSDRIADDPAACLAIRHWLHRGGHLWFLLDEVDPETLAAVLGNAFAGAIVGRLSVTELQIEAVSGSAAARDDPPRRFERPVELVRLLAADALVTHSVQGWPAALWKDVGRGKVLLTTVAPRGWLRPRTAEDLVLHDREGTATSLATEPFRDLAFQFLSAPPPPALVASDLDAFVTGQIGYKIINRHWIAGVLSTFCFALLGSGLWLNRSRRLEHIGWIGPFIAVSAAMLLAVQGRASRQAVPSTVGIGQVVQAAAGSDEVQLSGLMVLYNQESVSGSFGAQHGGVFMPDRGTQAGSIQRMVWTDRDVWHWDNVTLPPGLRKVPFEQARKLEKPLVATATFGPDGVLGRMEAGPFSEPADVLIALPTRRHLAPRLGSEGSFSAGAGEVLAPGQFVSGNLLSSQQQRRRAVYEQLLSDRGTSFYPPVPMLLAWAEPLDLGFDLPEDSQRIGDALLAIPLQFEAPSPGTAVRVPAPLIGYRAVGRETSATYDNDRRQWLGPFTENSQTVLRFQLPDAVLPLQIERAVCWIEINAPSRQLEVLAYQSGEPVSLISQSNPLGRLRVEIDRAELLQLDADGGLLLGIHVRAMADSGSSLAWKIDDVQLEVQGRVLAP